MSTESVPSSPSDPIEYNAERLINGFMLAIPYEYYYDYENRLVRVTDGSSTIAEYDYDALGRRIMTDDQTTVIMVWENWTGE